MKLKAMSFNLRINTKSDGINAFSNRRGRVKECILAEKPDIIGFQEADEQMTDWLRTDLRSRYYVVGIGRNKNLKGEGARIAYNKKKFDLVSLDTRWLSETPDVPGSRFSLDQSIFPRVYTVAEFADKRNGKIFRVFNTHLDHKGESAKLCGAVQIINRIHAENERNKCATILMGDFNAVPDSPVVKTVGQYLTELTYEVGETFHGFGKAAPDERQHIDYIFSDAKALCKAYRVENEPINGVYVSDHYPVCAFVEI